MSARVLSSGERTRQVRVAHLIRNEDATHGASCADAAGGTPTTRQGYSGVGNVRVAGSSSARGILPVACAGSTFLAFGL